MARPKPYRMRQAKLAKRRTEERILNHWGKDWFSSMTAKEKARMIGINAETRTTCSCDWCTPEHWTLSRQGRQMIARTLDQMAEVEECEDEGRAAA